ncbi:hypothetical protein JW964_25780 [candidate division KSB1 bacterium]|nr:hypothetical protein [candidate division KSB1 bacterium]
MNQYYSLHVSLFLKTPLLSSGGEDATHGISRMFFRNAEDQIVLQGSHVKGKLREAMEEITALGKWGESDINSWFGPKTEDDPIQLNRARLQFSDFRLVQAQIPNRHHTQTRVSIDSQTGTSRENFLLTLETLYPSGTLTEWRGIINFFAASKSEANKMGMLFETGLRWIAAMGGIKGCGYGRLEKVQTALEVCQNLEKINANAGQQFYHIIFEFESELFVGGLVNHTNFRESQKIIPGSVIKGALARFLNELCGVSVNKPIDKTNTAVSGSFPQLAERFSQIGISHAFPCPPLQNIRAVTIPFSVVKDSQDNYSDVALCPSPMLDQEGKAPEFQIDWKNPHAKDADFGWPKCGMINKTRTRIESKTRTAKEEALYTFQYLSPYANRQNQQSNAPSSKLRWIANITLPSGFSQKIIKEIQQALNNGWCFLGKRNTRFTATLHSGHAPSKIAPHPNGLLIDDVAIVSLQTDALLFDAYEQAKSANQLDLRQLYQEYWNQATGGTCEMTDTFFARQKFWGGYIARRFKALSENHYYPFILTAAGSVFKLKARDPESARTQLQTLQTYGLPLPESIISKINKNGIPNDKIWEYCPFVPENGFGEININLKYHWEHQFQS